MAEQIIRGRTIVDDHYTLVQDDVAVPSSGDIAVKFERYQRDAETLATNGRRVAVVIDGEDDARALGPYLDQLAAVFVDFPTYADGRGYSHARILRDELGYAGELRATGEVLRDQMFYLARVGFDAFAPRAGLSLQSALAGLDDFSVTYQAAADERRPIYARGIQRPVSEARR